MGHARDPALALIRGASNEICRWVSPSKHFMRTATRDIQLHDQTIKAGEAVALFFPSGNRDETAFPDPLPDRNYCIKELA